MARLTEYREEYAEQAAKLCKLGATDADLAMFFEVAPSAIYRWKLNFPEFKDAIQRSKDEVDATVEQSLYRRATGYSHSAVKIMQYEGGAVEVPYVEHYAPDPASMIFWLKNRQPERWRDKVEHEHSGNIGFADRLLAARDRKTAPEETS